MQATNKKKRLSVSFSDVIRYSDNSIGYIEFEDDDIVSTCSDDESKEEKQEYWNPKPHPPPSLPSYRHSLLNSEPISIANKLAPILPQRRMVLELNLDQMLGADDDSIFNSPHRHPVDFPGRSLDSMMSRAVMLGRNTHWLQLLSDGDDASPPVMPKRQLSGDSVEMLSTPPTSRGSVNFTECNLSPCGRNASRWQCNVPPPPLFE
ncbi:unnamed protein product [Cylindrotheca closterium]|uniref:Uncharacterized protein n=1 Tax=Cylindrotheca closterium TaxID=2856 RepID=A0AAD2GAE2_9STRA|nr:unnamed protein product [Cylindrotheca closterium]